MCDFGREGGILKIINIIGAAIVLLANIYVSFNHSLELFRLGGFSGELAYAGVIGAELHCPNCNRRLFDFDLQGVMLLRIKCPKCNQMVDLSLKMGGAKSGYKTNK